MIRSNCRGSSTSAPREHLAQGSEIVLHNIVEPMREQNNVDVGKYVCNPVVPFLHGSIEPEIRLAQILKMLLHFLELRAPVDSINEAITPGTRMGCQQAPRE
jgi:hypothetical protein